MPRKTITETDIITASWKLLASDGLDKFSMRKLSQLLQIKAPSLYWYVKSKDELFDKLASQILSTILADVATATTWQEQLFAYGQTMTTVLRAHPYAAYLVLATTPDNQALLQLNNELLKIIDALPFDDKQKLASVNSFINYILSFEIDYLNQVESFAKIDPEQNPGAGIDLSAYQPSDPVYRMTTPEMLGSVSTNESFTWGLTIFIKGLAALAQA